MKELNEKIYSYSEVSEFMNELHKIPAMEFSADKDDQQKHRIWLSFDLYNQHGFIVLETTKERYWKLIISAATSQLAGRPPKNTKTSINTLTGQIRQGAISILTNLKHWKIVRINHPVMSIQLNESKIMQDSFELMAKLLLEEWAHRITSGVHEPNYNSLSFYDFVCITVNSVFENRKNFNKFPPKFQQFLKYVCQKHLRFEIKEKTTSTSADYSHWFPLQPEINLYFNTISAESTKILMSSYSKTLTFLSIRKTALIHELIHAYDDYISGGKFRDPNYNPYKKEKDHNKYLNYTHEINARFFQTVASLPKTTIWKDYLRDFKYKFEGWKFLSPTTKKRLITRLATRFQRKETLIDITPFVDRLKIKIKTITDADVYVSKSFDNIEIENIDKVPNDLQKQVLTLVCRTADIFQRKVETSDKLPLLKEFGFIKNSGRNKDFRISRLFYRPERTR